MAAHRSTGGVFLDARSVYAPSASKLVPCLSDQVIRENPASRGTETSAEVLVGPPFGCVEECLPTLLDGVRPWVPGSALGCPSRSVGTDR